MSLRSTIRADLGAYFFRDIAKRSAFGRFRAFLRAYLDTDFRVVFHMRIIQHLSRSRLKSLGLLLYYRQKSRYCVDISPWAEIGPGLRLNHAFNIVVGPHVRIGPNCMMFNGVTLGNARPDIFINRMPTVGARCILGTGAKIFGTITIGDDVLVGANLVVKQDLIPGGDYFQRLERDGRVRMRRPPILLD